MLQKLLLLILAIRHNQMQRRFTLNAVIQQCHLVLKLFVIEGEALLVDGDPLLHRNDGLYVVDRVVGRDLHQGNVQAWQADEDDHVLLRYKF